MGTTDQNYRALRAEINDSWTYSAAWKTGALDEKTVRGMAKMGFTKVEQGEAFKAVLDRQPANLQKFFTDIGNQSVGNNRMDGLMRAVGSRYNSVLPNLAGDFRDNPNVERQLRTAIARNPDAVARALSAYDGRESGPGKLETLLNNINNPPRPAAPVQAAAQTRTAAPPPRPAARPEPAARPAERSAPARREAPADKPEPVTAVAGASSAPAASTAPAAVPSADGAMPTVKPADVGRIADTLGNKLLETFPDMANEIDGFVKTLKSDEPLQARIAQNLNNNPEFLNQLMQMANSTDDSAGNALKQYGRNTVQNLLNNPQQLADDKYVKDLSGTLSMASGGGGILDSIKNLFSGMDLGGIGDSIMSFLQPLIDMFKDLFAGFSANGGVSNVLTMGNGNGDFLGNALGNMQNAIDTGRSIRGQEANIERDQSVRAVDRNRDGRFSDGNVFDGQGKPVMEQAKDKDGKPRVDSEGKPIMTQKYDAALDDRIEVNGKRVFDLGLSNANWTVYAERVDPSTGRMLPGSAYSVRNGQVTPISDNDNDTAAPAPTRTLDQTLRSSNNANAPVPANPGQGPGGGAATAAGQGAAAAAPIVGG